MTPKKPMAPPKNDDEVHELLATIEEVGGPEGADPTRFGDWVNHDGRCSDF